MTVDDEYENHIILYKLIININCFKPYNCVQKRFTLALNNPVRIDMP